MDAAPVVGAAAGGAGAPGPDDASAPPGAGTVNVVVNGEVQQAHVAVQTFYKIDLDTSIATFLTFEGGMNDILMMVIDYLIFVQNEFLSNFKRIRHAKVSFVDVRAYSHHIVSRSTFRGYILLWLLLSCEA